MDVTKLIVAGVLFLAVAYLYRYFKKFVVDHFKESRSTLDDVIGPILLKILKYGLYAVVCVVAAGGLGLDISWLAVSLSVAALGIAESVRKAFLDDLFLSIKFLKQSPFGMGDTVVVSGKKGLVVEVGWGGLVVHDGDDNMDWHVPYSEVFKVTGVKNESR